jgi:vacuolar-type H+-ATPase subunit H
MPKKPVIDHEEKESLVPSISHEEDRIQKYLDAARREARQIVEKAEEDAAEREKTARESLPAQMDRDRAGFLSASQTRAEALRAELSIQTEGILKKAEAGSEKAVSIVVEAVWPGETK